jgi:hypothetical protein
MRDWGGLIMNDEIKKAISILVDAIKNNILESNNRDGLMWLGHFFSCFNDDKYSLSTTIDYGFKKLSLELELVCEEGLKNKKERKDDERLH